LLHINIDLKKFFTILLLLLYGLSVQGATIQVHYCMGKWAGIELVKSSDNTNCSNCGMLLKKSRKGNCCKDVQQKIQVSQDQSTAHSFVFQAAQPVFVLPAKSAMENLALYFPSLFIQIPATHVPPDLCSVQLFIRNRIFLI